MASFYAELHVEGATYRVVHCAYACQQATDARGRVQGKVRHAPLQLVLDVPEGDDLLAWATTPFKPLAGEVVFYDLAQQTAHETITFAAGECVAYGEQFASGATGDGAYVCQLTITAPSFELQAGGPGSGASGAVTAATPLIQVAQRAHELAAQPHTLAAIAREADDAAAAGTYSLLDPSTHFVRPPAPFDWELSQQLEKTFPISLNTPHGFAEAARADLQAIYSTSTGRKLIESIQASGKKIPITYHKINGARFPHFPDDPHGTEMPNWKPAFYDETNTIPGPGLGMSVQYDPFREEVSTGTEEWHKRPPGIALAHELIHAEQAAHGRMLWGDSSNAGGIDPANATKLLTVPTYELETVGVPPYDRYPVSENKIRAEWNPPQTPRRYY